jgi:hypothetical protein
MGTYKIDGEVVLLAEFNEFSFQAAPAVAGPPTR